MEKRSDIRTIITRGVQWRSAVECQKVRVVIRDECVVRLQDEIHQLLGLRTAEAEMIDVIRSWPDACACLSKGRTSRCFRPQQTDDSIGKSFDFVARVRAEAATMQSLLDRWRNQVFLWKSESSLRQMQPRCYLHSATYPQKPRQVYIRCRPRFRMQHIRYIDPRADFPCPCHLIGTVESFPIDVSQISTSVQIMTL